MSDQPLEIPASHIDLLEKPLCCAFSTLMPDGAPQTTVVWFEYDGRDVYINTMRNFRKARNMRRDPRVTPLVCEAEQPSRFLELRGRLVPRELCDQEVPVKCRIELDHYVAKEP